MVTSSLILFAIQSALKLGERGRLAYVDALRRRELVLPLSDFRPDFNLGAARNFFRIRGEHDDDTAETRRLIAVALGSDQVRPSDADRMALAVLYREMVLVRDYGGKAVQLDDGSLIDGAAFPVLIRARQWARDDDPTMSVAERMAGTVIDIGVDYFRADPSAINPDSRLGKALGALLEGLDKVEYGEAGLGRLPQRLLFATLETVGEDAALLSDDPNAQALISAAAEGLATDIRDRLAALDDSNADRADSIERWGETVFRSLLGSAGRMVVTDPGRFLGLGSAGGQALTREVGGVLLDTVLGSELGALDMAFGRESLDRLTEAALGVIADHPELVMRDKGFRLLVSDVAEGLAGLENRLDPAVAPEVLRLIIEKTGRNLDHLWPAEDGGPGDRLLKTAALRTLELLSAPPAAGASWRPVFAADQIVDVVDTVLDEVVENPGWLIGGAADIDVHLGAAVESMVEVLRTRADSALSAGTGLDLLRAGLTAAAVRAEFVDRLPNGQTMVAAALDAVLTRAFDPGADRKVKWRLLRTEMLEGVHALVLDALEQGEIDAGAMQKIETALDAAVQRIAAGEPLDLEDFAEMLAAELSA